MEETSKKVNREIKFRGLYNGGWVYGDLIQTEKDFKKVYQIADNLKR